jgi:predicted nuclease of predicted toxin-antitoxin system
MTKDRDFAESTDRLGPPPAVILFAMGNTSTAHLIELLKAALPVALDLVAAGEALIEVGSRQT